MSTYFICVLFFMLNQNQINQPCSHVLHENPLFLSFKLNVKILNIGASNSGHHYVILVPILSQQFLITLKCNLFFQSTSMNTNQNQSNYPQNGQNNQHENQINSLPCFGQKLPTPSLVVSRVRRAHVACFSMFYSLQMQK